MTSPIRILLYSWPFAPMVGGLERLTDITAREIVAAGHDVTVVTATQGAGPDKARPFAVERRPGVWRMFALVRAADIVQLNTFHPLLLLLALVLRRRAIWQHIDFDTLSPRGICTRLGPPCDGRLPRCYRCLRQDHSQARTMRALGGLLLKRLGARLVHVNLVSTRYAEGRLGLDRSSRLSFGIETSRFVPADRDAPPPLRVFFTARHVPAKGCDVLVEAAALCAHRGVPLDVRVAGDGPHRAVSEQLARAFGLAGTVGFLGIIDDEQLLEEYRRAHVVVVPTTQDEIGQLVMIEAMACGCAIVASRIGALPEHVGDAGLLFPPGDADALARELALLAGDPTLVRTLGSRARARAVMDFDRAQMGERYVALYEKLAGERGYRARTMRAAR